MYSSLNGYPMTPLNPGALPLDLSGTTEISLFQVSATQQHALGRRLELYDGRCFRYAKNGAVQLSPGLMCQSAAIPAELTNEVQTGYTTAVGDKIIRVLVTTGNGVTNNSLAGATLVTQDGTGEAYAYTIIGNRWITSDTVLELTLADRIRAATAATSEFTIVPNRYSNVIVQPTTVTGVAVGVPNQIVPAGYYCWLQTKGLCPMVVDAGDTLVVGAAAGQPATYGTAGAVGIPAITTDIWGRTVFIGTAGETALIDLNLE